MITIDIQPCSGDDIATTSNHREVKLSHDGFGTPIDPREAHLANLDQAVEKAIAKRYGNVAVFMDDRGLRHAWPKVRFGQVFRRIKGERGYTSMTGRVCITITVR